MAQSKNPAIFDGVEMTMKKLYKMSIKRIDLHILQYEFVGMVRHA